MSKNRWSNQTDKKKKDYDNGGSYGGESDGASGNRYDRRWADSHADEHNRKERGSSADDLAEWIQDMVQDAVDSMDFSNLSQNIRDAVDTAKDAVGSARETMAEQMKERSRKAGKAEKQRYGKHYQYHDSRVQQPVESRQPRQKGWIRKIPGRWSGPVRLIIGACGMLVFGALSLGFGLAGIGFSMTSGIFSTATIVLESVFIPLTIVSGVLFGTGRAAGNRVRRLREYAGLWGEKGFIMLQDLKNGTGYAMKRIQKDIRFLLDNRLIPYARMDESQTCLILTKEAGEQYDVAVRSRIEREQQEARRQAEESATPGTDGESAERQKPETWTYDNQGGWNRSIRTEDSGQDAAAQKRPEEMTEEERKMYQLQQTGGSYLQELRERKARIQTPEVSEKLDRLELLLSRIFVCIKEYPENISQADRLLEYYLPSVMKLVRVYEDMEKQPIQSVNIIKTRMEIAESLDTVNQALEAMYDDMFQDVAMDISSDIKVLETMLEKDGWGAQKLHSQREPESSIWDEQG